MAQKESPENNSSTSEPVKDGTTERHGAAGFYKLVGSPFYWLKMLASKMHWSFVFGVISTYGVSEGIGVSLTRVATDYYMKDIQKIEPSESQAISAVTRIPWIIKPIWGILTDILPLFNYQRRPYFIIAGLLGVLSMLVLSVRTGLHIFIAVLALSMSSAGVAIADVTIDACIARNSIENPFLAPDIQSLCAYSYSVGALIGYSLSGVFIHLIGPKGVFGLLTLPSMLVGLVGILISEPRLTNFTHLEVNRRLLNASKSLWIALKCPSVWRPCVYMYMSNALSLNIHEGLFYWFTDTMEGPSFSQETIGFIFSIGSIGALIGAALYQIIFKDHPLRDVLLWTQIVFGLSGMLDLIIVFRLNLELGMPDYVFVVIDEAVSQMIVRLKLMPLLVLSSKLCPPGIEGTFFALLMSIDNAGIVTSSWGGGWLLHALNVTRTGFDNLWLAILIRNIMRVSPVCLLFLVPTADTYSVILADENMAVKHVDLASFGLLSIPASEDLLPEQ